MMVLFFTFMPNRDIIHIIYFYNLQYVQLREFNVVMLTIQNVPKIFKGE